MANGERCVCPGADEIIADLLEDDLMALEAGEQLWKLYCFRVPGHETGLRHRIYTKRKADGRLAMLTFAAHNPPDAEEDGREFRPRVVRSALARVSDLAPADLDRLITAMQASSGHDACEEIDLSVFRSVDEQWAWLREQVAR